MGSGAKVYNWKNGNLYNFFSSFSLSHSFEWKFFFISFIIYTILNPFCMFGHSRAFYELTLFFFGSLSSFPNARVNKINNSSLSVIMCLIMLWLTLDCSTHHLSTKRETSMLPHRGKIYLAFFNSILLAKSAPNFSFFIKQMKFVLFFFLNPHPTLLFSSTKNFFFRSHSERERERKRGV